VSGGSCQCQLPVLSWGKGHKAVSVAASPYLGLLDWCGRHFDFESFNSHGMVFRLYSRAVTMSINLGEFCSKKQYLR
jgi:hypothetical protein